MHKPIVDLDLHTITCSQCSQTQTSPDLTRHSPSSVQSCVDRFTVNHRCGIKAIHRVRLEDITAKPSADDRWKHVVQQETSLLDPEIVIDPDMPVADRWRTLWKLYEERNAS